MTNKRINKIVEASVKIQEENVFQREALGFYSSSFISCTLPHKNPGDETTTFGRRTSNQYFGIQAGYDGINDKSRGLPYGSYPRLLLCFVMTEATRTKNPVIKLGNSLSEFMNKLGIVPYGGRWGSITRLKNQINRLFHARIHIQQTSKDKNIGGETSTEFLLSDEKELWWSKTDPNQSLLWESTITLSEKFFNEIITSPVPIDLDVLKTIRQSPLAIDLYLFLTHRVFKIRKPVKIPWTLLHKQLGAEYKEAGQFAHNCKKQLKVICGVYTGLNLSYERGNLVVHPSLPSVPPKKYL